MTLNQHLFRTRRFGFERPEMEPDLVELREPMSGVVRKEIGELINVNHLIEDVAMHLPEPMAGNLALSFDLAPDLPLIEGDYRVIRRLLLDYLSAVHGKIVVRTQLVRDDRPFLHDSFNGSIVSEGNHVLMQLCDFDTADAGSHSTETVVRRQFRFVCAAMAT